MKFTDYTYSRPNYDDIKVKVTDLTEKLAVAASTDEARQIVQDITTISSAVDTQMNLWSIRHSIDMRDEFYNQETIFWNEHNPLFDELWTNYYRVIVDSPYRPDLADLLPETFFMLAENRLQTFSSDAIPLFQKENELVDQYNNLMATAQLDFRGQTYNLSQMGPFNQSIDRATRKEAAETVTSFFEKHETDFDRIYDQLVKTRHEIATTLGFTDYVEYGYKMMNRFDYNRDMVKVYREEILKHVVPVVQKLRQRQAKRIQVQTLSTMT